MDESASVGPFRNRIQIPMKNRANADIRFMLRRCKTQYLKAHRNTSTPRLPLRQTLQQSADRQQQAKHTIQPTVLQVVIQFNTLPISPPSPRSAALSSHSLLRKDPFKIRRPATKRHIHSLASLFQRTRYTSSACPSNTTRGYGHLTSASGSPLSGVISCSCGAPNLAHRFERALRELGETNLELG